MSGKVGKGLAGVWRAWRWLIQSLVGAWSWDAPPWARKAGDRSRILARAFAAGSRRRPWTTGLAVVAVCALAAGAVGGWRWYAHRPKPELAAFTVTSPGRTRIEEPRSRPDPLVVRFDRSAAALAAAGKPVDSGLTLEPALPGTWRWIDDRVLEFRVRDDWPVGEKIRVTLDRALFGPQVRLDTYGFDFSTASFVARVANVELYQDPVNAGIRRGVFDIQFTHPVDPAEFERHLELRLAGQKPGVLGIGRETLPFSVVYDKLKLNASVHSADLPIPKDPTELQLRVTPGLAAQRGGNRSPSPLAATVKVPGLYSLSALSVEPLVVENDHNEPEQVLLLTLSAATGEREVAHAVSAWVLPRIRPADGATPAAGTDDEPYEWSGTGEVTADVLRHSDVLALDAVPAEHEFTESHSFRHRADVGRYVLVQIDRNLRSFGGYLSPATQRFIVRVPPFPPQLKVLSQGSLLSLSGERKVVALVRDLPGLRVEIGRVLPDQLQHLISQSGGDFSNPVFNGGFGPDNLVERFERKVPLAGLPHGRPHYEPIDLGPYLKDAGTEKRGLFLLTVRGYDPALELRRRREAERAAAAARQPGGAAPDADDSGDAGQASDATDEAAAAEPGNFVDQRLVLVTDLGILVKKATDGAEDVFVQSIDKGTPVAAAIVDIVATNGTTLFSQSTDADGRAHFQRLDGLVRERAPLFIQVRKAGDLSFLPLNRADRTLDYSRFDVGGLRNARNTNEMSAYLFSDRGMYRPGDTVHVGMIAKTADWSADVAGIPLEYEVQDPRGLTVKRERYKLSAGGFAELSYTTADTAATGTYTVNLYIVKDGSSSSLIGTTSVRIQEFEPDRMKVGLHLSAESADGWVSPRGLKALVNVQNLFGTPAQNRRIETSLTLTPAYPAFRTLPDYHFYDPLRAKEGYDEKLTDATTDAAGDAVIELGLEKYARATYRARALVRAFEPGGGRGVGADTSVLVSDLPFLIGFKADGELAYVSRGGRRVVSIVAIDPAAHRAAAGGLSMTRLESQFVSVLTRQPNGTYKYESRKKETTLSQAPLAIPAGGLDLTLATDAPGTFAYVIQDAAGLELNRIEYTVAGTGNVTRSLERNAELQIVLDKKDYAPGEEIELNIKAPYTGAGLITIERDHVYATRWFKSATTASIQKIRVPAGFEGNGYVSVQFIRDPGSEEVFTSPLSYGIAPFMTSLAQRTNVLTLKAPEIVKPGDGLDIHLEVAHPTRAVVFAVDEGILQVAHYQTPDPLGYFFKKRALEVRTSQILDLILPEFKRVMAAAAPGGDAEAALRRNLNPFKRKHDQPAVYWSGIVDVAHAREFHWTVPDSFNGALKIFAVAVDGATIGVTQMETRVRGDFVLTPNMPVAVAPGDEFEVSVGVANNVPGSGTADITVSATPPAQLEAVGPAIQVVPVGALREGVATFRFRALTLLGPAPVTFGASWQKHSASLVNSVSVRPASPYVTDVSAGFFGASTDVPIPRQLYPELRKLRVAVSTLPLVLVGGLADYLNDYPHLCTEQLVSRGFPTLILGRRPELADPAVARAGTAEAVAALVAVLRSRQNAEGGFGLWSASVDTDEFASVYAMHWLIEAREQGAAVPDDLLQHGLEWLRNFAASPVPEQGPDSLGGFRNRAYAAYLLTRRGTVTTPMIASLRESLDSRHGGGWRDDATAAFLAAIYKMQRQEREAEALMEHAAGQIGKPRTLRFSGYYDATVRDAEIVYLLARHFPDRARRLAPGTLQALVGPMSRGGFNTLSAALVSLAVDAYAAAVPAGAIDRFTATMTAANGTTTPLPLQGHLVLRGAYAGDTGSLHLDNASGVTGFFAVINAGYDRAAPAAALQSGLEILREYLDAEGRPVKAVKTGQEITVRLRLRAIKADFIPDVAVTDLLPGGFELVQPGPAMPPGAPASGAWEPRFADLREDRVVLYGNLSKDLAEYSYRIRATNAGVFQVPPSYAESMYERTLRARGLPDSVTVR